MPVIQDGSGGLAKAIVGSRISTTTIGRRAEIPQFWEEGGRIGCCQHDSERIPRLPSSSEQKRNVQGTLHEPGRHRQTEDERIGDVKVLVCAARRSKARGV